MKRAWIAGLAAFLLGAAIGAAIPLAIDGAPPLGTLQPAGGSQAASRPAPSPAAALPTSPALSQLAPTATSLPPLSSAPTPLPAPATTSEPSATVTPTDLSATAQPAPTPTAAFRTVLDERFADNQRNWPNDPQSTAWLGDGGYRLFARQPGRFVAVGAPIAEPLRDVVVTGAFRKVGGAPGGGYGLIVRDRGPAPRDGINQEGRFYVLGVGDRGEVGIWRREGDQWIDLLPWTGSAAVRPGNAPNELRVRAAGPRLTFLVNATEAASVEDPALEGGGVGVFVGGDFNEVVLERFVVEVPS